MLLKGRLLLAEKKLDAALASVQEAAIADPRSIHAHYTLGLIHLARYDMADATKSFNDVLKLNPRAVAAQLQLSRLHLTRGSAGTAVQFAEEAVKNLPRNAEARLTLARGLIASGQVARAEAEITPLARTFPNSAGVQIQVGTLQLAKKNFAAARRAFDRALELDRNSVDALAGLLALDVPARRVPEARTRIESRLADRPTDSALLILAAHTYAAASDAPKAEEVLRRAIDSDPTRLEPYAMLGQLYVGQNRLDEARKEFDELSKREANSIGAHTMVGTILHIQNKVAEARDRYRRVLAIDPRSPVAANNLAWLYAESGGNLDVAVDLALTARAALPDQAAVSDTLGWVYYKKDRAHQAIAPLRDSVAKDPQNPVYQFHLGLAYAKTGEKPKAREALEQALKLNPDFDGAAEARKVLSEL
jgi:tetratricopeptide (TPR) repeat protein